MIQKGTTLVYGIVPIKPLAGFPKGRFRVRMRSSDAVKVYVHNEKECIGYYVSEEYGCWVPRIKFAVNGKASPKFDWSGENAP
jgi:hypothetical protein